MKEITASMAGTVWQVLVSEGDEVTAGQTVIILESMKMEIPVDAAEAGTVESIKFASGDFVNEGDVLVTLK
ncbi:acetyl-CoA carboxylase biotin carboxyl carrier protein subunit [Fictibacillus phosphorivorans]|uniref:acetyl-CoA carboxylase biotin carboxyl carrier protein subunit n=1 Tax=Fictibacillus phosphorivorans TaxID=1221500 RepID=UPI00203F9CDB|nr:acetyl-CoA carboxylase biotin carboxyl carrier protein subunit [Fictibacillus phosphorivorans]MCM3717267.1 acetyl-CoA carboxylase biotin carboxyl carrier protein subunit [Fictibacillus phosphorivorans]MCM3774954.1 acetyl-CoA carboxylase biotin carboxyl carrier protein subunit [Fictibacillus phosphorivorans]